VWKQDGFSFDAGPTIITAPFLLDELWATAGRKFSDDVELKLMDPFYRIRFDDGSWFDYCGDAQRMRDEVARFSPEDLPGYERFLEEAAICYQKGFIELGGIAYTRQRPLEFSTTGLTRAEMVHDIHKLRELGGEMPGLVNKWNEKK
jgi:phytoene desaturase